MRCQICDCILSDEEATKKDFDGEFLDICDECEDEEINDELDELLKENGDVIAMGCIDSCGVRSSPYMAGYTIPDME